MISTRAGAEGIVDLEGWKVSESIKKFRKKKVPPFGVTCVCGKAQKEWSHIAQNKGRERKHMCSHEFLEPNTPPCASPLSSLLFPMICITSLLWMPRGSFLWTPPWAPQNPPPFNFSTLITHLNAIMIQDQPIEKKKKNYIRFI